MRTLQEAIDRMESKGGAAQSLRKHLDAVGIREWDDVNRANLYDLADHLRESVAPQTGKTIAGNLKGLIHRYEDELDLPHGWEKCLALKGTKPMKTYLTEEELEKFEKAEVHTDKQRLVKNLFLICAYTGLRVSDALTLTPENIGEGCIRFTAKKTKKVGTIPLKPGLEARIRWNHAHRGLSITMPGYNQAVRKIAQLAGIDSEVVVQRGGVERKGPKWKFITSHTARISTATNLSRIGATVAEIQQVLQHTAQSQTEAYIVKDRVELSQAAMRYFV